MVRRLVWTHAVPALRQHYFNKVSHLSGTMERWSLSPHIVLYCTIGLSAIDDSHSRIVFRFGRRSRLVRQLLPVTHFVDEVI